MIKLSEIARTACSDLAYQIDLQREHQGGNRGGDESSGCVAPPVHHHSSLNIKMVVSVVRAIQRCKTSRHIQGIAYNFKIYPQEGFLHSEIHI